MEYQHQGKLCTMRYYRFSRRRINYLYDYRKARIISTKKQNYMVNTGRSKLVDGIFFENQFWGALHKAWKGYVIAKNKYEYDKMEYYADIIQECQADLGLPISSFDNLGKSESSFYSSKKMVQKNNNEDQTSQQHVTDIDQIDQYEEERYTDEYKENFADDEADRYTDDNAYRKNFTD